MKLTTICFAVLLIAGAVLLGTITAVGAETTTNPGASALKLNGHARQFELEPFVGYHFFGNQQNLKDRFEYGGRLGYNFSNHFGVEVSLGAVNTHVDDASRKGAIMGQYRSPTDGVDLNYYGANAIYQFSPEKRLSPFVVAGFSDFRYDPQVLGNNTQVLEYGIGAKYWLKKDIALRVDLRDQSDKTRHNYSATVGVVYAFGASNKHEPPAIKTEPIPEEKEEKEVSTVPEETPVVDEQVQRVVPEEKVIVLAFEDVHFNFDKSTLTEAAKVILERNIRILKDNPHVNVRIVGYTSASGSNAYNLALSKRRAQSVENYLVNEGNVSPDRLTTIGYGESNPAEYEAAPKQLYSKAAMANMRVLFETIMR